MGVIGPCLKTSFSDREMLRVDEIEALVLWGARKRIKGQTLFDSFVRQWPTELRHNSDVAPGIFKPQGKFINVQLRTSEVFKI